MAVETQSSGLVSGRISALALDPSDSTGNRLYVGTTGGGVWAASNANASDASSVVFAPLTDAVSALDGATDASISIGALTVQPGGTGVILAGTGDPNDVLDSYYGAGILRSTDGGTTWTLIQETKDAEDGLGGQDYGFVGEGFAGFAWSTANPQVVVAAVSQAYEGTLVNAGLPNLSYEGLYYSSDSGATWHLAMITDGSGKVVQGPLDAFAEPDGNAATAVVWNPVRKLFVAAVRFHGYYQSADGVTWTRIAAQPGAGLSVSACPNNLSGAGSTACPIFRGALAVNPITGDTFAWTVDLNNQDKGLWQDECNLTSGACGNGAMTFSRLWSTGPLQTSSSEGAETIANGDYNLALAAVPSGQDTLVLAADNDLWKCSLAAGCAWRNTTNSTTCMSAQVGEFQHSLAWNAANPLEIFAGNDSGLWRSTDGIGETGSACSTTDATHFDNLNGSLGSLAEVTSLALSLTSPYAMIAGLGVNGTTGVKSAAAAPDWPQILSGYGGPVAIDPEDNDNWYVNNGAGVSIYRCSQSSLCTPADFGAGPVITNLDVNLTAGAMPLPAPFLVDPHDSSQLLIGTCQLWRGPASGTGWTASSAVTPILDSGATHSACSGDALIRSMSAIALSGGREIIYLGMYGAASGGENLPGHVLSVLVDPSSSPGALVSDLTSSPVAGDTHSLNYYGLDISSVFIDPHDPSGETIYATVEGVETPDEGVRTVYRSTDGGAHWTNLTANLPATPVNSLVVDPQNPNTVYLATDEGVYFTSNVASCPVAPFDCWTVFGTGLPAAPAVALSTSAQMLIAATYGRGIWQTPAWSGSVGLTSATAAPSALTFGSQMVGTASATQTVSLENTGSLALSVTSIAVEGAFSEIDGCVNTTVSVGGSCAIQVAFAPTGTGPQTGQITINANVSGGQIKVALDGTGTAGGTVTLSPNIISFGQEAVGSTSAPLQIAAGNSGTAAIPITGLAVTGPFAIAGDACGTVSLAPESDCQIQVSFKPAQPGPATGTLTLTDGAGTQTVDLNGTGLSAPSDTLSAAALTFPATATGQASAAQSLTITNSGGQQLTSIAVSASSGFATANACGTELAANSSCTIAAQFVPAQTGNITGTLTISDELRTRTVSLSGTGVAPAAITVQPTSLIFNDQQPGVASAPQTVTVTNSGGAPMANVGFQITGSAAASYAVGAITCTAVLSGGSRCAAQVVFTPAATGPVAAALVVSSSTLGVTAVSVPLNGSGQSGGGLKVLPSLLTFSAIGVGQTSTAQAVTITDSTSNSIASITLAIAAPFSLAQNGCTGSLAAGASCNATVVFTSSAPGPATGALTISAGDIVPPATVVLSGTGFDFSISSSGPAGLTVTSGQTARFLLVITPNGSQGTFSFACGKLPANAGCAFNPTGESLNAGVQGNVTAEIATGGSGAAAAGIFRIDRRGLPLLCGLLVLPLAFGYRRRLLLLAVLCVILAGISSCTSSSGGAGGGPSGSGSNTPPGTYTIPVAITSLGVSHSLSVTLTVD
jgi:hypothetical protein